MSYSGYSKRNRRTRRTRRSSKRAFGMLHTAQKIVSAPGWGVRKPRVETTMYRDGAGYSATSCIAARWRRTARKTCGYGRGASPTRAMGHALSALGKRVLANRK